MKKTLPFVLSAILLNGCLSTVDHIDTSTVETNFAHHQVDDFTSIQWAKLELPAEATFAINKTSQIYRSDISAGPIAAFTLPADRGGIKLNLKSYADITSAQNTLYPASVMVINQDGTQLAAMTFNELEYHYAKMMDKDYWLAELTVIPKLDDTEIRVLVYANPEQLTKTSTILHPAKAFAIAKNTVPPEIADPVVNHTASGSFFLEVESAYVQPVKTAQTEPTNDYAPALDQTQGYYLNSIEEAVANGEINKAMQLLEEAERLGIKDARSTFVNAVENK